MKKLLPLALAGLLIPVASSAQSEGTNDPYAELVGVLTSPEIVTLQSDAVLKALHDEMAADSDIAEMEAECPGGLDKMMTVLREVSTRDQAAETEAYRKELVEFFRANMPAGQAAEAAEFYGSEIGQKVLMSANRNRSFSSTVRAALQSDSGTVDQNSFAADTTATQAAVATELRAELFAASIDLSSREWPTTLSRLRPQMQALSLKHLNAELTLEEDAELEARFDELITAHIEACYE